MLPTLALLVDVYAVRGVRFHPHPLVTIPAGILAWLFVSLCLSAICRKAGKPGGCLVWIPLDPLIPAMEVAQMSILWLIALIIPLGQIVFAVVLGLGLARARHKDPIWGVLFAIPCTAWLGLLYLAIA